MVNTAKIQKYGKYYVGLDIGTSSVGRSVTDIFYNVLKFNGNSMWGIRLFEEAKTAEDRRHHRAARRRNDRKKDRIKLLQDIFSEAVSEKDFGFFMRLKESALYEEDKSEKQSNTLFNDIDFSDKEYYKKYPTIYHLRKELMESKEPHDVRLVYLAIHHILKHRGHFLYSGDFKDVSEIDIEPLISELEENVNLFCNISISVIDVSLFKEALIKQELTIKEKKSILKKAIDYSKEDKKQAELVILLFAKGKVKLCDLFNDTELNDAEKTSLSLKDSSFEDDEAIYKSILLDRFSVIESAKQLCDWGVLHYVLDGERNLSSAKVKMYAKHSDDLKILKQAVKEYCDTKTYDEVFRTVDESLANYCAYVGLNVVNGEKQPIEKSCDQEEFCKYLNNKVFKNTNINSDPKYADMLARIENGSFMRKQKTKENGVIPNQIHKNELKLILNNAKEYLPFLAEVDENGISTSEKIIALMTFRIPYYVGPINTYHKDIMNANCWAVRKADGPIRPWNFDDKIDREASAEEFIRRMTNKCTYLNGEDVIPKDSILYSKFVVLNELNNLRINDEKISVQLKQDIYNDLFLKNKKVTRNKLRTYLIAKGVIPNCTSDEFNNIISGIDGDFSGSMGTYIEFCNILGKEWFTDEEYNMIDEIVKDVLLFGDDKKLLKYRLKSSFREILTENQINKICRAKYSGWGRLSKEFLVDVCDIDETTGEYVSIIGMLYNNENNPNLNQILSNDYNYAKLIEERNSIEEETGKVTFSDVNDLYVSPAVKRSIWQALKIVDEIVKIIGYEPEKVFIEMARGGGEKGKRSVPRRDNLVGLYKKCKEDSNSPELFAELESQENNRLRSDKLYLYYTQLGRSMYSGKRISLDSLEDYDIDHIYPQSKVLDDSIDNRVLVEKTLNSEKGDGLVRSDIQASMRDFWYMLYHKQLISKKKLNRLMRTEPFTIGELEGFVSRQLVETRQSTKAVAQILKKVLKDSEVVYVKAGNISKFRHGVNDIFRCRDKDLDISRKKDNQMLKCRLVNDYHHAKDAYLNIVVGNVFHTKFTSDPKRFFASKNNKYSLNAMYRWKVERNNVTAWIPSEINEDGIIIEGTMVTVKKQMSRNDIQFTRLSTEKNGGLFDVTLMKKGKGQVPQKENSPIGNIDKYGGYNKAKGAYFFVVEHTKKGKRIVTIETMMSYKKNGVKSIQDLEKYCHEFLELEKAKVLVPKLRFDTILELNGFRMHITGRTGVSILMKNANPLILSPEEYRYSKRIESFINRSKDNKNVEITAFDAISENENIALYDTLLDKMSNKLYSVMFNFEYERLKGKRDKFVELTLKEQAIVLNEILLILQCNRSLGNLELLGEPKKCGTLKINKNVTGKDYKIVNQSVTGLFEKKQRI